jgi:hypothetical protein
MAHPEDRTPRWGPWSTDDTLAFDLAFALLGPMCVASVEHLARTNGE